MGWPRGRWVVSWGFGLGGLDNAWWDGFSCGVAFNDGVKRPGQGVSGAPDTGRRARRGRNGCDPAFGVWVGLAPEVLVFGEVELSWGFSGAGVRGGSGAGCPCVVVGVTLRRKWGQGDCSVASVPCRRGRDGFPGT